MITGLALTAVPSSPRPFTSRTAEIQIAHDYGASSSCRDCIRNSHRHRKQQLAIGERTGGRHRASGLTEILARELWARGRQIEVEHLHVHLPRVLKAPANGTAHPSPTQEATR